MASSIEELARILEKFAKGGDLGELEGFATENGLVFLNIALRDPADDLTPEQVSEWELFRDFLVEQSGWDRDGASHHIAWLLRKDFKTPDEWLGEEGIAFRRRCGMSNLGLKILSLWHSFCAEHQGVLAESA